MISSTTTTTTTTTTSTTTTTTTITIIVISSTLPYRCLADIVHRPPVGVGGSSWGRGLRSLRLLHARLQ